MIWARFLALRSSQRCRGLRRHERDMLLAALFELLITHAENDLKAARIKALVVKLGGDPDAVLFGAS
jgi:hypothetical protein